MGGNTEALGNSSISAEFNFDADPESAFVVLDKTACPTYVAPIELCQLHSTLDLDWRQNVLGKIDSSMADFLNRLEKPWFERHGYGTTWKAWDQLAMMAALEKESIVKSRWCKVVLKRRRSDCIYLSTAEDCEDSVSGICRVARKVDSRPDGDREAGFRRGQLEAQRDRDRQVERRDTQGDAHQDVHV